MLNENLEAFIKAQKELLNDEAYDFINTYSASDSAYFSDAVAEFADGRCNIYYEDQRKYFYDNAENLIYIDRFDDIVDAVNEKIKGTAANE